MPGSGGGSSTSKTEPWSGVQQPLLDLFTRAQGVANDPSVFAPYGGQTVANLSPMTGNALEMLTDFAQQGSPERSAGGAAVLNATQGNMNPYATAMNPYMGDSPYLQAMIGNSNNQIAQNFAKGTAAQTDSAAARSGAFGGSAYNEAVQDNNRTLAGAIGANTNNMLNQQYTQSQNLAENALNRATGGYDNAQNRALQGAQLGLGYQQGDLAAIQAMLAGGANAEAHQQNLLNAGQQYYQGGQQAQITPLNLLQNIYGTALSGFGQNTQTGPAQSPLMGLLGAGALGYGMFGH